MAIDRGQARPYQMRRDEDMQLLAMTGADRFGADMEWPVAARDGEFARLAFYFVRTVLADRQFPLTGNQIT
jgi:hypothetical protein